MIPGPTASRFYARGVAIVVFLLLAFLVWSILSPFLTSLLWGTLMAFMLNPWHEKLSKRWGKPTLSSLVVTLGASITVLLPLSLFAVISFRQAWEMIGRLQEEATERKLPALQVILELAPVQKFLALIGEHTSLSKEEIIEQASLGAQLVLKEYAGLGGAVVAVGFNIVIAFLLTMFVLFFLLRDGANMAAIVWRLVPMREAQKRQLAEHLGSVTRAVVLGTLVTSLVQGVLLGIGFAIAGLPTPVVFGAVGAMCSLIPVVGTTLVWVPAVMTLLVQDQVGMAIFLGLWCIILVAGSDNLIKPLIISGKSNVSTLLVFLGVLGGVRVFGLAGLFAGPLVLTLVVALVKFADADRAHLTGELPEVKVPPPVIPSAVEAPTTEPVPPSTSAG